MKRLFVMLAVASLCILVWLYKGDDSRQALASAPQRVPSTGSSTVFLPFIRFNVFPPPAPLYRFGISSARRSVAAYSANTLSSMRFGYYLDFSVNPNPPQPIGMEYTPMVRVKQWKIKNGAWTTYCVHKDGFPELPCDYAIDPIASTYNHYTYTFSPSISTIQTVAQNRPGSTWFLGNEMERVDFNGGRQDEILPELYADFYHQVHTAIKAADPTAQVAIGGVVQATPLRLQYLSRIWDYYNSKYVPITGTMPVDIWSIHEMILQEKSCFQIPTDCWGAEIPAGISAPGGIGETYGTGHAIMLANKNFNYAIEHIRAMRQWMLARGQQGKPLVITEYSVLFPEWFTLDGVTYPFTNEQVRDSFLYPSFNYFLGSSGQDCQLSSIDGCRLVQRWTWYSLDGDDRNPDGSQMFGGNLHYSGLEPGLNGITSLGTYWIQYVQGLPAGASKPYAPVSQSTTTRRSPVSMSQVPLSNPAPVDCAGKEQIRLIYTEPSPPSAAIASMTQRPILPPKVVQEATICLPSK